jgi:hypothetical protein
MLENSKDKIIDKEMKINKRLFFLLRVIIELVVDDGKAGFIFCRLSSSSSAELSSSSSSSSSFLLVFIVHLHPVQ